MKVGTVRWGDIGQISTKDFQILCTSYHILSQLQDDGRCQYDGYGVVFNAI